MEQPLLKYLQKVKELEGVKYTQDRIINNLKTQSARLGRRRNVEKRLEKADTKFSQALAIVGLIGGAVISACILIPPVIHGHGFSHFISELKAIVLIILWAIVGIIGGLVIGRIVDGLCANARNQVHQAEYMTDVANDEKRVQNEMQIQKTLHHQIETVKAEQFSIAQALDELYSLGIVHPKYRSLIPVTMFCEYIETGRCSELTGHEGAYNIYEQEMRMDQIITQIDTVIKKLDDIQETQYALYSILSESNRTLNRIESKNSEMIRSLGAIEENSELTAYNSYINGVKTQALTDIVVMREWFR